MWPVITSTLFYYCRKFVDFRLRFLDCHTYNNKLFYYIFNIQSPTGIHNILFSLSLSNGMPNVWCHTLNLTFETLVGIYFSGYCQAVVLSCGSDRSWHLWLLWRLQWRVMSSLDAGGSFLSLQPEPQCSGLQGTVKAFCSTILILDCQF